jgi:hypothetical protein
MKESLLASIDNTLTSLPSGFRTRLARTDPVRLALCAFFLRLVTTMFMARAQDLQSPR